MTEEVNFPDPTQDFDDEDVDEFQEAADNCGQVQGGGCMLIGSEYCDWDCPFSADMWRNLRRVRDEKGRFAKVNPPRPRDGE